MQQFFFSRLFRYSITVLRWIPFNLDISTSKGTEDARIPNKAFILRTLPTSIPHNWGNSVSTIKLTTTFKSGYISYTSFISLLQVGYLCTSSKKRCFRHFSQIHPPTPAKYDWRNKQNQAYNRALPYYKSHNATSYTAALK